MAIIVTLYAQKNVPNLAASCSNQYFNHISLKVDIYLKKKKQNLITKGWRICNNCSSFVVSFAIRLVP